MTGMAMADDEWEWPEEKPSASNYYNSGAASFPAPEPKKLAAKVIVEEEDPSKRAGTNQSFEVAKGFFWQTP